MRYPTFRVQDHCHGLVVGRNLDIELLKSSASIVPTMRMVPELLRGQFSRYGFDETLREYGMKCPRQ